MKEWGFGVDSEEVDLGRIYNELSSMVAIAAYSYLEQLKKHAPIVHSRLKRWARDNDKMHWWGAPWEER